VIPRLSICLCLALLLAACGGHAFTGFEPAQRAQAITADTSASASAIQMANQIRTIGNVGGPIAHDGDDHIIVVAMGNQLWRSDGKSLPIAIPSSDPSQYITGVTYSKARHQFIFSSYGTIYESPLNGAVKALATGFSSIQSLTLDSTGQPYVIDNDHVATVSSGKPKPITAAGSIKNPDGQAPPAVITSGPAGILYVADAIVDKIYQVTTTGTISRLAGRCVLYTAGGPTSCWPGNIAGTGASAVFGKPDGLAFEPKNGLLYVADATDGEIWTVTEAGAAKPIAGYGAPVNFNGSGFSAFINSPAWSVFDSDNGDVYFAESTVTSRLTASLTTTGPTPTPAPYVPVLRYPTPSIPSQPQSITTAPDQTAWEVENYARRILHVGTSGNLQEYKPPTYFWNLGLVAVDASGNAWVTGNFGRTVVAGALVEVDAATGAVTGYNISDTYDNFPSIAGITLGPDNNIWFTVSDPYGGAIGYIVPATGAITQYRLSTAFNSPRPGAIAVGPDDNLWYAFSNGSVGRITTGGTLLSPFSAGGPAVSRMARADNLMWFINGTGSVGSISTQGAVQTYSVGCFAPIVDISAAADGTLWLAYESMALGHMTSPGSVTPYYLPQGPYAVATRNDGTLWATSMFGETYYFTPSLYDKAGMPRPSC